MSCPIAEAMRTMPSVMPRGSEESGGNIMGTGVCRMFCTTGAISMRNISRNVSFNIRA